MSHRWPLLTVLLLVLVAAGCGDDSHDHAAHAPAGEPAAHGPHPAPAGTTGVAIGDHVAQLAVAVDAATGTLTVRVYNGDFTGPVRLAQPSLAVRVLLPPGEYVEVTCAAQASALSGETVGDSSTFVGQDDTLKTMPEFEAIIPELQVRGQTVKDLRFPFPAGIKLH